MHMCMFMQMHMNHSTGIPSTYKLLTTVRRVCASMAFTPHQGLDDTLVAVPLA